MDGYITKSIFGLSFAFNAVVDAMVLAFTGFFFFEAFKIRKLIVHFVMKS